MQLYLVAIHLDHPKLLTFVFVLQVENATLDIYQGKQIRISRYTIHLVQSGAPEQN
ncbi:MAG: hypothetical protein ACOX5P_08430 [Bacilli bacterium]